MARVSSIENDPFVDPASDGEEPDDIEEITLPVGRNASLTLGTDSLIVLDEIFSTRKSRNCCGLIPAERKTTRAIPFFNVLWAEIKEYEISIRYANAVSKDVVRVASISYTVDKLHLHRAVAWISRLLDRAYGKAQRKKRIKVLINPAGGQGNAQKLYTHDIEPILAAAGCDLGAETTQYQGHATEITEKLHVDSYDVIAACSGDGLPYEIFNGLGKRSDARIALSKLAVIQLPCGSGNAMCWNLYGTGSASMAALATVKGIQTPLDLISITQGDRRTLSFLSQSYGIVAECDLNTDHLRWMGSARFTYGYLVRLLGKTVYPCEVAVKVEISSKPQIREHYRRALTGHQSANFSSTNLPVLASQPSFSSDAGLPDLRFGTVNDPLPPDWTLVPCPTMGNFWAGNMAYMAPATNIFQASLPSDGFMDLVSVDGAIPRSDALRSMLAAGNDSFFEVPCVQYRKVSGYRFIPRNRGQGAAVSIDGERLPCEPWQAEVHHGLGTVLSRSGHLYEAKGV